MTRSVLAIGSHPDDIELGCAGALLAHMMPLLHGLPVGGVASIQTNAAVVVYGTLFVTVRVDGLVQAP